jgi:hypothetical protein
MNHCRQCKAEYPDQFLTRTAVSKKKPHLIYYICRSCNALLVRRYRATKNGLEKTRKANYASFARNKERVAARAKVRQALKTKKITKPTNCQHEGCNNQRIEAHHPDYSKPLDVVWLCRTHHANVHQSVG